MIPRLKTKYHKEVVPALQKELGYGSPMQVPKITKVVINQSIGSATKNLKILDTAVRELTSIAGQKAIVVKAKRSISNFSLRVGMPIAAKITLRNHRMYEFLDRLISLTLTRIPGFSGVNQKAFDGRGNYTLGIKSQTVFPEIKLEEVQRTSGMDISIVATAKDDETAYQLLKSIGLPF